MQEYISQRLQLQAVADPERAKRLLSTLMTFPLTLSQAINSVYPPSFNKSSFNVVVIGARAESSLPLLWWREILFHTHISSDINIRFVGPQLQVKDPGSRSYTHSWHPTSNQKVVLDVQKSDNALLHQHDSYFELLLWGDLFVLFHPGYGSKNLNSSWRPTISGIIETRKPILATAFSKSDLSDDVNALKVIAEEEDHQELGNPIDWIAHPSENPFSSCRQEVHPVENSELIISNQFSYIFQWK